jgi:hypothetical protein
MQGQDTYPLPNLPIAISLLTVTARSRAHQDSSSTRKVSVGSTNTADHGRVLVKRSKNLTIGMILCGWPLAALPLQAASYYLIRFDDPLEVY